ncbi:hypothetical protein HDU76_007670, partial [Blyttiomyces sp. JEL0837]
GYVGGDGFVFWYAKDTEEGPFYGAKDNWKGLALIFDTSDVVENRYTPYIYGVLNDGSKTMAGNPNYLKESLGGCFRDYRNAPHPVWVRVTYANNTLRVDMDLRQDGYAFVFCFEKTDIHLPVGYHFGLSATTSEHHADDHDIHSMEVFEVNPQRRKDQKELELDADAQKKIHDIEKLVQEQQDADAEPGMDGAGYQEAINPHVIQQLEENQFKIIEALNALHDKVGQAPIAAAGLHESTKEGMHQAVRPVDIKVDGITQRVEELTKKVQSLSDDVRQLFTVIREFSSRGDSSLREVADKLATSNRKLDEAHSAIKEKASTTHYLFYIIFFLVGGVVVYGISVVYRMKENSSKKFI